MFEITKKIKLFAFDLDGTIYMGDNVTAGAIELVEYLKKNYRVVFLTNNSSKTACELCDKLNRLGIKCKPNEVYSSAVATISYLKEFGIDNLYVIGSDGFRGELRSHGLQIIDNDSAENVVVGFDSDINYHKITTAQSVLMNGGRFIVCNDDGYFPVGTNRYMPGCGAMVGAVAASVGKQPDCIVGKPNTYLLSKIEDTYGVKHHEIVVVGDSYESDVRMALNNNSKAVLVNSKPKSVFDSDDVLVVENLYEMLQFIKEMVQY